jgi:ABC-type uncharacterized transport system permease subunit
MERISVFCFLASYVLATVFAFARLRFHGAWPRVISAGWSVAGLVAHTAYLLARSGRSELPPLLASSHDWFLVLAWIAVMLFLFLDVIARTVPTGMFVLPIVLTLVTASQFVSDAPLTFITGDANLVARRGWGMLHASLLVFGIGGVLAGLILAVMYLVQHRRLKQRQTANEGLQLPSLARLSRWNWWAIVMSVPLLTFGMGAGFMLGFASRSPELSARVVFSDPVVIGSGLGWLVMVSFFGWLIATTRPAARQVAMLTLWACGFMVLTVVGLQVASSSSGMPALH